MLRRLWRDERDLKAGSGRVLYILLPTSWSLFSVSSCITYVDLYYRKVSKACGSVKLALAKDLEPNIPMEDADRNTYTELPQELAISNCSLAFEVPLANARAET
jgi:hypothetical protein